MLFFPRRPSFLWLTALVLAITPLAAQDKITLKGGRVENGQVTGVKNNAVVLNSGGAMLQFPLAQIERVEMTVPAGVAQAKAATSDKAKLDILVPLVNAYAGLPADWVPDTMTQIADIYAAQNQMDKASAVYADMAKFYPGKGGSGGNDVRAKAGFAKVALGRGNAEEALSIVKPLIEEAEKNLVPSATEGRVYADAYLVQGQAYEKSGRNPEALQSYLTVVTAFYQNPAVAKSAQDLADALRKKNPGLAVP